MHTQRYSIDITPGLRPVIVSLSQYDSDYRLVFSLYSHLGELDIEEGTAAVIRGTKPDGNVYLADAAVFGTSVIVDGDQQMTAVAGTSNFELTLFHGDKELSTANFVLKVERAPMDKDTPPSKSKIRELIDIIDHTKSIIEAGQKAKVATEKMDALAGDLEQAITAAAQLEADTAAAQDAKTALDVAIDTAGQVGQELDGTNTTSESIKEALDDANTSAVMAKDALDSSTGGAQMAKDALDGSVATAGVAKTSLDASIDAAVENIAALSAINFDPVAMTKNVSDLRAYLGLYDNRVLGVQVDYENKTYTRLAGANDLSAGTDFDAYSMFGGRIRCNVSDDGTITAWYGDANYKDDGSNGQVMVYQPKFYYLVCPVVYDPIDTGIGYHLRKANYYVSEKAMAGFRLHPAFYDANGNEIDYILDSAFEGSIWDADGGADGTGAYLLLDEQVMTVSADKFCSIAGAKPASGLTQNLTRPNIEQMAKNRGDNWHGDLIKPVSARQLLMIVELGMMNTQTGIGQGVVSIADNSAFNCSSLTGSTASLGNGTGQAAQTINEKGGTTTTETASGKTAITWRGTENPWGNIWKFVYGINIWGNGAMGGGQPFICTDFNFAESKNSGNYEGAGFTVTNADGYISAMGYSTKCDWLFIASETLGNSSLPVGDYHWIIQNLNDYRIAQLGGRWTNGGSAGAFAWYLYGGVGCRDRYVGGRLVYIPTRDSAAYTAAIASWKQCTYQ